MEAHGRIPTGTESLPAFRPATEKLPHMVVSREFRWPAREPSAEASPPSRTCYGPTTTDPEISFPPPGPPWSASEHAGLLGSAVQSRLLADARARRGDPRR